VRCVGFKIMTLELVGRTMRVWLRWIRWRWNIVVLRLTSWVCLLMKVMDLLQRLSCGR
jgi:hypothetical protein